MAFFRRVGSGARQDATRHPIVEMIDRTQAVIEFQPDGTILTANENFLTALGYTLDEIQGNQHAMFLEPGTMDDAAYTQFWKDRANGNAITGQFARRSKSGATVWIQATYAPIFDADGQVTKVMKIASDVTARRKAVEKIAHGLSELSKGNLTHRIPPSEIEDINAIGKAYNLAVDRLSEGMQSLSNSASQVRTTGVEMGNASSDLSTRTAAQAATLEQTAAAVEELTATVKSSAEGALNAADLAKQTLSTAENSDIVVSNSIKAMSAIKDSSSEISKIISVIDDISFQTNLLALNAGVEAARAGDAGKGFAVVASEVRGLAHRSQDAAAEIKALIDRSTAQVAKGVELVNSTGDELKNIIQSVTKISATVTNISQSTIEQSTALDEINTGVGHLDGVTQQNASMVDQVAMMNQALIDHTRQMDEEVQKFRFDNGAVPLALTGFQTAGTAKASA